MIKVTKDVTNEYYDILDSFRADNVVKVIYIKDNKINY